MILGTLAWTIELYMTKYIIGEIFNSCGATLYKNPSDQTVYTRYNRRCPIGILKFWLQILVRLQGWMSSKSALFVIEFICKSSVGIIGATSEMKKVFKEIGKKKNVP